MLANLGTENAITSVTGLVDVYDLTEGDTDVEFIVIENVSLHERHECGRCLKVLIIPRNRMSRF